ncbi:Tpl protein [Treponema primitia ZAS-2]|uniref:Tpl protein n=1 Tax=Treponema primitia (strain ATCC BAA-887 / DSM 12427 / ZAS-2) TaxID=545694 RepID=F5YNH3_TREPZ|nr:regulatory iron-sulfur-containing complex subunit RicT [Treponema primitia]AEF85215.1 Tpl protein [Treponema primitia ZAS-2]
MSDEYEDMDGDEDISALEDNSDSLGEETDVIVVAVDDPLAPDTPVYRLRLSYSNETFLAAYKGEELGAGSWVMVPTRYGRDLAQIIGPIQHRNSPGLGEISRIERPASKDDLEKSQYNRKQEKDAFRICKEKIETHRLEMKLVSVHYLLEEPKILFFFTAENRVDFRELVKDLVSIFKTRIELRQIGVRDESRVVGGLGVCGRAYCCHAVSDKLKPVSIKMAKDQNLSLNSMKISGPCGRLLCCLAYEHNFYNEQRRLIPPEGCKISYDDAIWKVVEVNVVVGTVKLSAEDSRQVTLPAARFEKIEGKWQVKAG